MELPFRFTVNHNHEFDVDTYKREKDYGFLLFGKKTILRVRLVKRKQIIIEQFKGSFNDSDFYFDKEHLINKIEWDFKY